MRTNDRGRDRSETRTVFAPELVCVRVCLFRNYRGNMWQVRNPNWKHIKTGQTHSRVIRNAVSLAFIALLRVRARMRMPRCVRARVCLYMHLYIYAYFKCTMPIGMQNNDIHPIDSEHFKNVNNKIPIDNTTAMACVWARVRRYRFSF